MTFYKNKKDYRYQSLDGACFTDQSFNGHDFTGANLSESIFIKCCFIQTDFTSTCLAKSQFVDCIFDYNTLLTIKESDLVISNCVCQHDSRPISFNSQPVTIYGLGPPTISLIGDHIFISETCRTCKEWLYILSHNKESVFQQISVTVLKKALSLLVLHRNTIPNQKDVDLRIVALSQ